MAGHVLDPDTNPGAPRPAGQTPRGGQALMLYRARQVGHASVGRWSLG